LVRWRVRLLAIVLGAALLLLAAPGASDEAETEGVDASELDDARIAEAMQRLNLDKRDLKENVNRSLSWNRSADEIRQAALTSLDEGDYVKAIHQLANVPELEMHVYCAPEDRHPLKQTWVWGIPRPIECEGNDPLNTDETQDRRSERDDQPDAYVNIVPTMVEPCSRSSGYGIRSVALDIPMAAASDEGPGEELLIGVGYPRDGRNPTLTLHGFDQGTPVSPGEAAILSGTFDDPCYPSDWFSAAANVEFLRGSLSPGETVRYTHGDYSSLRTHGELVSRATNTDIGVDVDAHNDPSGWGIEFEEIRGDFLEVRGEVQTDTGKVAFRGCDTLGTEACKRLGNGLTPLEFRYNEIGKAGGGDLHQLYLELGEVQPTFRVSGNLRDADNDLTFSIEGFPEESWLRYDGGENEDSFASVDITRRHDSSGGHFRSIDVAGTVDGGDKRLELAAETVDRFRVGFGDDDGAPHGPSSGENKKVTELTVNHAGPSGTAMVRGENTTSGSSFTQWLREVDANQYEWEYEAGILSDKSVGLDGINTTVDIDPAPWKEGIFLTFLGSTDEDAFDDSNGWLAFDEIEGSGKMPCVYHWPISNFMGGGQVCT
jgi:hypothetical protein